MKRSLLILANYALAGAETESDQLAVYDSLANIALESKDADAAVVLATARETAISIRKADDMRIKFRDLIQGQLNLGGTQA